MANILFCWELGAGLGHAGRLKSLALPLRARGHACAFALRDLVHTRRLLAGLDIPGFQAPLWLHRVEGLPAQQASLAEILLACGWFDVEAIAGLVEGWRNLLKALRPALVVCDYAPAAVLAARSLDIQSSVVGPGFQLPPAGEPLPPLREWETPPRARMAAAEARVLDSANRVLARHGKPALAHASALLLGDTPLLCTWPELDPWDRGAADAHWFGPNIAASSGVAPRWPAGEGAQVFAYLRGPHPEHDAMLRALAASGCRTLCYLPEAAGGKARPFIHPLIAWAEGPVDLQAALRDAAFVVCHASESTVAQALLAGRPLLMLPPSSEAFLMARRVRQLGAGININEMARPLDWDAIVRDLLKRQAYRDAAQAFARRHAGYDPARQAAQLADILEGLALR